ncbi:MAG: LysM peptidoglycan-binding domain-containing protein [Chryseolinea sp.]
MAKGPVAQVEDENSFSWAVDPASTTAVVKEAGTDPVPATTKPQPMPQEQQANTTQQTEVASAVVAENTTSNETVVGDAPSSNPTPTGGEVVAVGTISKETTSSKPSSGSASNTSGGSSGEGSSSVGNSSGAPLIPPGSEQNTVVTTTITPPNSVGEVKTEPVSLPKGKETHTVKQGETLYGISKEYGVPVMDLVEWNGLVLQDGIKPGQVLKLRSAEAQAVAAAASEQTIEHVVRSTDTLYSVARKYNVTIKELMDWNHKKDFNLSIGEKLIVKGR